MTSMTLASLGQTAATASQTGEPKDKAKLEKAAKAFEAVFVRQLIGSMRQGGFGDDLFSNSGVEQFQEMADARTADTLADHGGLGIAELLLGQLGSKDKKAATDPAAATKITTEKPE